jgi:hypothetical protein
MKLEQVSQNQQHGGNNGRNIKHRPPQKPQNLKLDPETQNQETESRKEMHAVKHYYHFSRAAPQAEPRPKEAVGHQFACGIAS